MTSSRPPIPLASIASLKDDAWDVIKPHLTGLSAKGGRPCIDCRKSLDGMRWVAATKEPWADMPLKFGKPETVRRYYARLKKNGVIDKLLNAFPERAPLDDPEAIARSTAHGQLACLKNLLERRPRGRAAQAKSPNDQPGLSPIGDKPG